MQVLTEYERLKPDFVTMDISMPMMDGIEAVERIISRFPEAKVIMVSALNQKEKVFRCLKIGAKNFIVKPFMPEKVIEVVNSVLK
ncbi:MAG: response regulator [Peptococcaceae bacterium]|nr:response regulator [Peptococcaceae bacterium]